MDLPSSRALIFITNKNIGFLHTSYLYVYFERCYVNFYRARFGIDGFNKIERSSIIAYWYRVRNCKGYTILYLEAPP